MPNTYKLMCVGPNLPAALQKKGQIHIHTADCADLKRGALRLAVRDTGSLIEVHNLFEIVTFIYPPEQFDWNEQDAGDAAAYWEDFHWAPCVKEIPTGFPEAGDEEAPEDDDEGIAAEDLIEAARLLDQLASLLAGVDNENIDWMKINKLAARLRTAAEEN